MVECKGIIVFIGLMLLFTAIVSIVSIARNSAFVIPGLSPTNFNVNDNVVLKTNKITSAVAQIPYRYHDLPVCKPTEEQKRNDPRFKIESENLGEILMGDRIEPSLYSLKMLVDEECKLLCVVEATKEDVQLLRKRVSEEYRVHWLVDNLPAAYKVSKAGDGTNTPESVTYEVGFPLGEHKVEPGTNNEVYNNLYNHVNIIIHVNENPEAFIGYRIVFFEVEPESVNYKETNDPKKIEEACKNRAHSEPLSLLGSDKRNIAYTYSVKWKRSATSWANRWDAYLTMREDHQIHWFSIINSLMIVLFLSGMVAMIMMRTLHADFRRYNSEDPEEADETGWKLVHADVFRPPSWPMLLSVLVGSGVQMLGVTTITMIFAVLGFLSPANRGGLMSAMLVLFVWMGAFAGYFSTRTYRTLNGKEWKKNALWTAILFPGTVFLIFFFLNFFVWGVKSSAAIPFGTLVALIALWFGISVPLCFFGSYFAWKKPPPEQPVRVNIIPRQIPEQVWYMHPVFSILMGGILPFGAVFIELFFILSSIWLQQFYYLFSFLFLVFLILIITCAEITIVMCYFQLCSEDYKWWWRSYLTSGASALYMFLYAIFYYATNLKVAGFISTVLYFGYSLIMALAFFVMTGTIGYYACYFFIRKIYSSVKFN
jgi:transmembrane 9 superfamily protein 2/4